MFYDLYKDSVTFNKTDGSKESTDVLGGNSSESANLLCSILLQASYKEDQSDNIEKLRKELLGVND